jgi:hypothetical protein
MLNALVVFTPASDLNKAIRQPLFGKEPDVLGFWTGTVAVLSILFAGFAALNASSLERQISAASESEALRFMRTRISRCFTGFANLLFCLSVFSFFSWLLLLGCILSRKQAIDPIVQKKKLNLEVTIAVWVWMGVVIMVLYCTSNIICSASGRMLNQLRSTDEEQQAGLKRAESPNQCEDSISTAGSKKVGSQRRGRNGHHVAPPTEPNTKSGPSPPLPTFASGERHPLLLPDKKSTKTYQSTVEGAI